VSQYPKEACQASTEPRSLWRGHCIVVIKLLSHAHLNPEAFHFRLIALWTNIFVGAIPSEAGPSQEIGLVSMPTRLPAQATLLHAAVSLNLVWISYLLNDFLDLLLKRCCRQLACMLNCLLSQHRHQLLCTLWRMSSDWGLLYISSRAVSQTQPAQGCVCACTASILLPLLKPEEDHMQLTWLQRSPGVWGWCSCCLLPACCCCCSVEYCAIMRWQLQVINLLKFQTL